MSPTAAFQHASDPAADGSLAQMQDNRQHLIELLRSLAARLDELDRRLAEFEWRRAGQPFGTVRSELFCERTSLESERRLLSGRLSLLAKQLDAIDRRLCDRRGDSSGFAARVGTCPYCGYPSLGSGLCAFCRLHLAR